MYSTIPTFAVQRRSFKTRHRQISSWYWPSFRNRHLISPKSSPLIFVSPTTFCCKKINKQRGHYYAHSLPNLF
jgi:hypothetical protein